MSAQSAPRILPTSFTSRRSHANTEKALYYLIAICLQVNELNYFLHILFPFKPQLKVNVLIYYALDIFLILSRLSLGFSQ